MPTEPKNAPGTSLPAKRSQLEMLWPPTRLADPPQIGLPPGYRLRTCRPGEQAAHAELMRKAGFSEWRPEQLDECLHRILPDGLFVIEEECGGILVATAMATHNPRELHPFGGELGWVAADPAQQGQGLGAAVCAAVVRRYRDAGYRRIYLRTDDWRLPALKLYLKLGWVPFLFEAEMPARWLAICEKLGWPYLPETWRELGI